MEYEKFDFKLKKLAVEMALSEGFSPSAAKRISLETKGKAIKAAFVVATQEDELAKIPDSLWQHIKQCWFPRWLLRMFPVQYAELWVTHKFPDLDVPPLGREFVSLKLLRFKDLEKAVGADRPQRLMPKTKK